MNREIPDIELIYKYYNGELDAKAMQQLEQKALDDPFLADAMDGFDEFSITKITVSQLKRNLEANITKRQKKLKATWGFRNWTVAASVVLLIGLASIYINQTEENKPIQVSELQRKAGIPKNVMPKDSLVERQENEKLSIMEESPAIVGLPENTHRGNAAVKKNDIIIEPHLSMTTYADSSKELNEVIVVDYSSRKQEALAKNEKIPAKELDNRQIQGQSNVLKAASLILIKGKVLDENGKAIPGANVLDKNTGAVVHTNIKGEFELKASEKAALAISFLGYQTKEIKTYPKDSLIVSMQPAELIKQ